MGRRRRQAALLFKTQTNQDSTNNASLDWTSSILILGQQRGQAQRTGGGAGKDLFRCVCVFDRELGRVGGFVIVFVNVCGVWLPINQPMWVKERSLYLT